jgi:hypothetical protein
MLVHADAAAAPNCKPGGRGTLYWLCGLASLPLKVCALCRKRSVGGSSGISTARWVPWPSALPGADSSVPAGQKERAAFQINRQSLLA